MKVTLSNNQRTNIHVEVYGEGSPVLFLHGGPGCCHDSFAPFFMPLAQHCQIIYYDQIACGRSDWSLSGEYHIEHELEVIEAIREQLGYEKLAIVGESWGTMLGLQYASHYPKHISNLILLSSVGYGIKQMQLFDNKLMARVSECDKAALSEIEDKYKRSEISQQMLMSSSQDILNSYYLYDLSNKSKVIDQIINFEQHLHVVARLDEELDYFSRMNNLRQVNIHMYQATHDIINDRDIKDILVDKLQPTGFSVVPECGHWIYLEQTDYINCEILNILAKR